MAYLLAAILQIAHERLLDAIKLGQLHANCLTCPLQVLRALGEVLTSLDASGRDGKGSLG